MRTDIQRIVAVVALALTLAACSRPPPSAASQQGESDPTRRTDSEKVVNVYSWLDYIAPDTVSNFEKETGIKVRYDMYDNNEVLETKLLDRAHKL